MTSAALNIARQIDDLTESEVDFLWDCIKRRRNESLLKVIDLKLEESISAKTLSKTEASERLHRLGIA